MIDEPEAAPLAGLPEMPASRGFAAVFGALRRTRSGATAIEYGLIAALIATAVIAGLTPLGNAINGTFHTVSNTLDTSDNP